MSEYLIILLSSVALFWRCHQLGLVADDDYRYKPAQEYKQLYREKKIPISQFVWEILYGAGLFKNVKLDHIFSVALHTLNACLIFKVSSLLPAALLYLCNPVNNQVSLWLNGRRYSIVITCVLLSWAFWPLAIILYPFAVWLHVSAVMFPALFLATSFWFLVPVGGIAALLVGFNKFKEIASSRRSDYPQNSEMHRINWRKAILYVKSIGYYVQHTIFPMKPSMYHEFLFDFNRYLGDMAKGYSLNFDFWKGAAILSYLVYEIAVNHNFWAFWFIVFISQYCNIWTTTMHAADRYCSMAGIGLTILLAQKIALLPQPYSTAVLFSFLTLYAVKYDPLFYAYQTWQKFIQYNINITPEGSRQRCIMARFYILRKDLFSAFAVLKQGINLRPDSFDMLFMMAEVGLALGFHEEVINLVERAEKRIPYNDRAEGEKVLKEMKDVALGMIAMKKEKQDRLKFQALAKQSYRPMGRG